MSRCTSLTLDELKRHALPPIAGPATEAIWNMIVLSVIALGRCSRGTRFGISDWRAGPSNEPNADPSAASR